jgi:hypothetical protein
MDQASNPSDTGSVILPLPPAPLHSSDMALYARFMRHLRNVPNSRMEIKILSAIQFTADMLDHSDAHVAKVLVENGLRGPRMAFPADFLEFMDGAQIREDWDIGAPSRAMKELKDHWDRTGEDKFAAFRRAYSLLAEDAVR